MLETNKLHYLKSYYKYNFLSCGSEKEKEHANKIEKGSICTQKTYGSRQGKTRPQVS